MLGIYECQNFGNVYATVHVYVLGKNIKIIKIERTDQTKNNAILQTYQPVDSIRARMIETTHV